jgi:bacteriorhodopsin
MPRDAQLQQSSAESKIYPIDFGTALLEGVILVSVEVTHFPPGTETALTGLTASIDGTIAYVTIPAGLDLGVNKFSCVATTSETELSPEVMLIITVIR